MTRAELPRRERGTIRLAPETYGHSRDGTPLEVWLPPTAEPRVLVVGGMHGDEPETTAVLSSALRSLAPWSLSCALVLAANPDGLLRGTRANANGVDLNRNLPTDDWSPEETTHRWGLEGPPEVVLDTGARAGSEPETRALIGLVERLSPDAVVAVHAPLACVDDPGATPLGVWLSELSSLPLVDGVGYTTPGSFGTWGLRAEVAGDHLRAAAGVGGSASNGARAGVHRAAGSLRAARPPRPVRSAKPPASAPPPVSLRRRPRT